MDGRGDVDLDGDRRTRGGFAASDRKAAETFVAQNGGVLRSLPEVLAEAQQQ